MLCHEECERTGVDVAHTGAHHEAFHGGETHRCVDTFAVDDSSHRRTVADMAGDNALFVDVHAEEFAHAAAHIAVACAVEAVAAHAVFGIIFIGKGIHICLGGHGLVECSVEYAYLRHVGHELCDGVYTGHVGGVVEGCDIVAFADFCLYGVVDEHALAEFLTAVDYTVAYGLDFVVRLNAAVGGVGEFCEDGLDGLKMVDFAQFVDSFATVGFLVFEETAGKTDFLYTAFGESGVFAAFEVDELIFYRAAARVENEDFHSLLFFLGTDCLIASDDDSLVDVFGEATAAEVVDGSCEALEHGAYSLHAAETLHEFVGDVAHLEVGEHEHVGAAAEGAVGSFCCGYRGHEGGVGLKFAVEDELGGELMCDFGGRDDFVDLLALGRTFGRERQDSYAGLNAGDVACCLGRGNGNLGELFGIGVGHNGAVGEDEDVVGAIFRTFGEKHDEST